MISRESFKSIDDKLPDLFDGYIYDKMFTNVATSLGLEEFLNVSNTILDNSAKNLSISVSDVFDKVNELLYKIARVRKLIVDKESIISLDMLLTNDLFKVYDEGSKKVLDYLDYNIMYLVHNTFRSNHPAILGLNIDRDFNYGDNLLTPRFYSVVHQHVKDESIYSNIDYDVVNVTLREVITDIISGKMTTFLDELTNNLNIIKFIINESYMNNTPKESVNDRLAEINDIDSMLDYNLTQRLIGALVRINSDC